jgi:hypothetical protein
MNLDIHDAVVMAVIVTILGALFSLWSGARAIRSGRKVAYYRLRRSQVVNGWGTIVFAIFLVVIALLVAFFAEPAAYRYFPPSPTTSPTATISLTPTISQTATITETPSITETPAESYTPTITVTPFMPMAIEAQFVSTVTPNPDAVFSPLKFSRSVSSYQPVDPRTVFQNPVDKLFVTYTYDGMTNGVQWTALWYRDGELLKYDTSPWGGGTGGYGQYELDLPAEKWLPGTYQLVFFVGTDWKVIDEFRVTGAPPTVTSTVTPTITFTATPVPSSTRTPLPTRTPIPTNTRWPSPTK